MIIREIIAVFQRTIRNA